MRLLIFLRKSAPVLWLRLHVTLYLLEVATVDSHARVMTFCVCFFVFDLLKGEFAAISFFAPWRQICRSEYGKLVRVQFKGLQPIVIKIELFLVNFLRQGLTFELEVVEGHLRLTIVSTPQIIELFLILTLNFLNFCESLVIADCGAGLLQHIHLGLLWLQIAQSQLICFICEFGGGFKRFCLNHRNIRILHHRILHHWILYY